jgi:hypothetical protein
MMARAVLSWDDAGVCCAGYQVHPLSPAAGGRGVDRGGGWDELVLAERAVGGG